ncbi:MAG: alpha/beta hydrolase, partial [Clostridiales bacterium]|nr:alpha/beta hydrolase [Clostridiales bacterium]
MLKFDENSYTDEELTLEGISVRYRAFREIPYVERPVDIQYQRLNIFVPLDFYEGKRINGYTLQTAPTFMPNLVGGYMPGDLEEPGYFPYGPKHLNSLIHRLAHGYVVVSPALRGRTFINDAGENIGKAP